MRWLIALPWLGLQWLRGWAQQARRGWKMGKKVARERADMRAAVKRAPPKKPEPEEPVKAPAAPEDKKEEIEVEAFKELLFRLGLSLADFVIFMSKLRESPWWQGHLVEVTLLAGKSYVTFPHGLGRAHRGAVVVTSNAPVPAFFLPATGEVEATLYIATAHGSDLLYRVWVF